MAGIIYTNEAGRFASNDCTSSMSPYLNSSELTLCPDLISAQHQQQTYLQPAVGSDLASDIDWTSPPNAPDFVRNDLRYDVAMLLTSEDEGEQRHAPRSRTDVRGKSRDALSSTQHKSKRSATATLERKSEVNRQAQRRFRERQKVRAQETAAELAETKLELQQMKIQQQQQEKLLLNRVNQADSAPDHTTDALQGIAAGTQMASPENAVEQGVYVSLPGKGFTITAKDFQTMSPATFGALWTVYALLRIREDAHIAVAH